MRSRYNVCPGPHGRSEGCAARWHSDEQNRGSQSHAGSHLPIPLARRQLPRRLEHLICWFDTHLTPNEAIDSEPGRLGQASARPHRRESQFKTDRGEWWRMEKMRLRSHMGLTLNQLVPGSSPGGLTSNLKIPEFFASGARRNASRSKELDEARAKNFFI